MLAVLPAAAPAAVPVVPTLPVSAIRPGQPAIVRTVFAGDSIETFDAEILGVMEGGRAGGDVILARATSARVVQTGIAAGMSGSPVYVDGKLVGALALGWPFSKEPIFGITPIADMLAVLDQPETAHPDGTSGPVGVDPGASERYRGLAWSDDSLPAPEPAAMPLPRALPIPLAAGGLAPEAIDVARDAFRERGFLLVPGGRARDTGPGTDTLVPGSACAVDVLRGDLNFSAIGTVTYRDGDRVLIFGHPFFQAGEVRMPFSAAHIVGILPSLYDSFKLGTPGRPLGVVTQDRRPAVGARLGGVPRLMPFRVAVRLPGQPERRFAFESIEDRSLLPQLVGAATMGSLLESGGSGTQVSVRWSMQVWRAGRALRFGDLAAGDSPLGDVMGAIGGPLRFLANNPFGRWTADSVAISLEVLPGRRQWTLRGASLVAASVRPGGTARVRLELERWRGERRSTEVELPVPAELPAGHYALWIGGGGEFDRSSAARMPAHFRPTSVADAEARLQALHASDAVYAALWARAPEVTREGQDYPELPASALALLVPSQAVSDRSRPGDWALMASRGQPLDGVLRGEMTLDLVVDDRAP